MADLELVEGSNAPSMCYYIVTTFVIIVHVVVSTVVIATVGFGGCGGFLLVSL